MKRRLFIAIDLDPRVRRTVAQIEKEIGDAFGNNQKELVRFVPEENWHITLSFLGTQDDASLTAIMAATRRTAENFSAPEISFAKIAYAPQKKNPRMIWLQTSPSSSGELGTIQSFLQRLLTEGGIRFEQESRMFSGHVTLARFPSGISNDKLPSIERTLSLHYVGASLDIIESELDPRGARYSVLQQFSFS